MMIDIDKAVASTKPKATGITMNKAGAKRSKEQAIEEAKQREKLDYAKKEGKEKYKVGSVF